MITVQHHTAATLRENRYAKEDLFKAGMIGEDFDYGLPIVWLKEAERFCNLINPEITDLVCSTTVFSYGKHGNLAGRPLSCCLEIRHILQLQKALNNMNSSYAFEKDANVFYLMNKKPGKYAFYAKDHETAGLLVGSGFTIHEDKNDLDFVISETEEDTRYIGTIFQEAFQQVQKDLGVLK